MTSDRFKPAYNANTAYGHGVVELDNATFDNCSFNGSTLVYRGLKPTLLFMTCVFENITIELEGKAKKVAATLPDFDNHLKSSLPNAMLVLSEACGFKPFDTVI